MVRTIICTDLNPCVLDVTYHIWSNNKTLYMQTVILVPCFVKKLANWFIINV